MRIDGWGNGILHHPAGLKTLPMAFSDFTFPQVQQDLGLALDEVDLFSPVPAMPLREDFVATVTDGATIALALIPRRPNSEFIIAPVLLEVRRLLQWCGRAVLRCGGWMWTLPKGSTACVISSSPSQRASFILSAPVGNRGGSQERQPAEWLGQCIATTYAATLYNQRAGSPVTAVCGVVTTGSAWKFLHVEGTTVTLALRGASPNCRCKFLEV